MKFKPTLVALAVSTLTLSVQAQIFTKDNAKEVETQTKFLSAVGAPQAWARGITGKGVIIGVVDNGFDVNHTDIKNNVIDFKNFMVDGKGNSLPVFSGKLNDAYITTDAKGTQRVMAWMIPKPTTTNKNPGPQLVDLGQYIKKDGKDPAVGDQIIQNGTPVNLTLILGKGSPDPVYSWGSHGTSMASIAAGRLDNNGTVGVAPDAKLVLAQAGYGRTTTGIDMQAVYRGMAFVEQKGASVINLSLGSNIHISDQQKIVEVSPGIFRAPPDSAAQIRTNSKSYLIGQSMKDVASFTNATSSAVIVVASGNAGAKYAQMPAAFATQTDANGNLLMGGRVLIVGNVVGDGNGGWTMHGASNRAGTICNSFTGNICNDKYYVKDFYVVAPGAGILAAIPDDARNYNGVYGSNAGINGIASPGGTSSAAAVVSGGMALLKQAWPQLTSAQMVHLVKTTATDMGAKGVDEVYGWGMVNFDKATQPQGLLTVASFKGYNKAIPLTATGIASSGSASINSSSVLQNVQGLDSYNRNYTLDMTRAVVANPVATYRSSSSYLAMNPANYNEVSTPVNENYSIKMMQNQGGMASEVTYTEQGASYSVQFGSMTEKSGFLGNYGAGMMAFGDSSTSYLQLGTEHKFGSVAVFGSYGFGTTRAGSVQDSMIQLGNRISSSTWKLGVAKNNVFQNKDAVSLSVVSPVSVRNGSATVTGVTGYEFTDNGDGADAKAIVSTETISLRAQVKPMDLVLGYTVIGKGYDRVNVNVARQFNVGGVAGNTANSIGVMAVKSF